MPNTAPVCKMGVVKYSEHQIRILIVSDHLFSVSGQNVLIKGGSCRIADTLGRLVRATRIGYGSQMDSFQIGTDRKIDPTERFENKNGTAPESFCRINVSV